MDTRKAILVGALVGVLVYHDWSLKQHKKIMQTTVDLIRDHLDITIQEQTDRKFDIITRDY